MFQYRRDDWVSVEEGRLTASELQVWVDMGLLNVGKVGFDTALNFALGLPKHDLGWPPQRPLFRDNIYSKQIIKTIILDFKKDTLVW